MHALLVALRRCLDLAGRKGPVVLLFGVGVGVLIPPLAELARPLMGLAVFCFTLGAFLKVEAAEFRAEARRPWLLAALLAWSALGVPLLAVAAVRVAGHDDALTEGLLLATIGPPVGSAAAVAVMLGLSAPLALIASVAATLAAPLTLPLFATLGGGPVLSVDPWRMMLNCVAIVGGAALAATLIRRFAGGFVRANPQVMTGVAVAGLLLVALASMRGMQPLLLADPARVLGVLALAFAINMALQVLGAAIFGAAGAVAALTAGLVSGNRNVTLAWAAAGTALPQDTELGLAMCVFPIFMLPALFRWLVPDPARLFLRVGLGIGLASARRDSGTP